MLEDDLGWEDDVQEEDNVREEEEGVGSGDIDGSKNAGNIAMSVVSGRGREDWVGGHVDLASRRKHYENGG